MRGLSLKLGLLAYAFVSKGSDGGTRERNSPGWLATESGFCDAFIMIFN